MSTVVVTERFSPVPSWVRRFTLDEYHRLIEMGLFEPGEHVELLEGVIYTMSPQRPAHAVGLSRLQTEFYACLGRSVIVRTQSPITLPSLTSEPEPDLVLARYRKQDYVERHPHPEDILLVVEISDTTLAGDSQGKASLYAASGLPDYWIMNLVDLCIKVHRDPIVLPDGTSFYQNVAVFGPGKTVAPLHFPQCIIRVEQVIPGLFDLFDEGD